MTKPVSLTAPLLKENQSQGSPSWWRSIIDKVKAIWNWFIGLFSRFWAWVTGTSKVSSNGPSSSSNSSHPSIHHASPKKRCKYEGFGSFQIEKTLYSLFSKKFPAFPIPLAAGELREKEENFKSLIDHVGFKNSWLSQWQADGLKSLATCLKKKTITDREYDCFSMYFIETENHFKKILQLEKTLQKKFLQQNIPEPQAIAQEQWLKAHNQSFLQLDDEYAEILEGIENQYRELFKKNSSSSDK